VTFLDLREVDGGKTGREGNTMEDAG